MIKYITAVFFIACIAFVSCRKAENAPVYDANKQLGQDTILIKNYLAQNNIEAVKHKSGIYYVLEDPGSGDYDYGDLSTTEITVKYTGKLLNGTVFDSNTTGVTFGPQQIPNGLAGLISAWQIALAPASMNGIVEGGLQNGGKIRIITPSVYAYGPYAQNGIPANSVLDFEIELLNVKTYN